MEKDLFYEAKETREIIRRMEKDIEFREGYLREDKVKLEAMKNRLDLLEEAIQGEAREAREDEKFDYHPRPEEVV